MALSIVSTGAKLIVDTLEEFQRFDPVIPKGLYAKVKIDSETFKYKKGDGVTKFTELEFLNDDDYIKDPHMRAPHKTKCIGEVHFVEEMPDLSELAQNTYDTYVQKAAIMDSTVRILCTSHAALYFALQTTENQVGHLEFNVTAGADQFNVDQVFVLGNVNVSTVIPINIEIPQVEGDPQQVHADLSIDQTLRHPWTLTLIPTADEVNINLIDGINIENLYIYQ